MFTNVSELLAASIIRTMMEEVGLRTAETSVNIFATIRSSIPEGCHVHFRAHNLKKNVYPLKRSGEAGPSFRKPVISNGCLTNAADILEYGGRCRKNDVEEREKRKEGK
jgi:hypothetical protein